MKTMDWSIWKMVIALGIAAALVVTARYLGLQVPTSVQ
jgi:hypothetical protein